MPYNIRGWDLLGAAIGAATERAKDAVQIARQWANEGVTSITITNPQGESYDIDRFGMTLSTMEIGLRKAGRT